MSDLPTGIVTLVFTDVEGSTTLWEREPDAMRRAMARHDELIEGSVRQHAGVVVRPRGEGDSRFAVFGRATDAVRAAAAIQRALHHEPWPTPEPLKVRIALHTGEAELRTGDYYGATVNRCARLRAAAHGGQTLVSTATQELVRDDLPEGVSLRDVGERRLKDLIRPERIFQMVIAGLSAEFPPLATLDARPNNLPLQLTPFIGRPREEDQVRDLIARERVRLLTLTGPGGTGKTRLGLQVAADLLDGFPDGVYVVPLAAISDPSLFPATIATALGVSEQPHHPLWETVREYLRDKELLLVLDNFEQVVGAAPAVAELLAGAPGLKVLATSRTALRLYGEREYPVPPLSAPDPQRLPDLDVLTQYGAVRLFVERARAVRPDFAVTNENAPAVAEICTRLDGLPLAIELAAARVRLLPPQAMLTRLDNRLRLLTGGARNLPARQQTLRGAIDWSYSLLDEQEQRLFARLGVFVGGGSLEAVEVVCDPDGELDALSGLESLLEKSLLRQEGDENEPGYVMLETIREYAQERLESSGEAPTVRARHLEHFLQLAARAEPELRGPGQAVWLARLEREHGNFRAALSWSLSGARGGWPAAGGPPVAIMGHARAYDRRARLAGAGSRQQPGGAATPARPCTDGAGQAGRGPGKLCPRDADTERGPEHRKGDRGSRGHILHPQHPRDRPPLSGRYLGG